ncbi:hypothetical protein SDC9_48085 [bioreactor metagenome]|jgi:hypothetical protein|uniref:Uncharacterized protein n=2 Tax=root TaxID=1 RepID=A0A562JBW8_9FIRM|nr:MULTISPECIES: hypothetical protein [Sedimentibacter]MEA5093890.1 hypothetical protein [Sedimentibacter saalensis]TWH80610.1 hypothetical protein LY60_01872 [Sedimentibacter saalensis]
MANKNIKKEERKKKKKTDDVTTYVPITYERPVMTQPELIKKKKKDQ